VEQERYEPSAIGQVVICASVPATCLVLVGAVCFFVGNTTGGVVCVTLLFVNVCVAVYAAMLAVLSESAAERAQLTAFINGNLTPLRPRSKEGLKPRLPSSPSAARLLLPPITFDEMAMLGTPDDIPLLTDEVFRAEVARYCFREEVVS
jgi:hypothetical protein